MILRRLSGACADAALPNKPHIPTAVTAQTATRMTQPMRPVFRPYRRPVVILFSHVWGCVARSGRAWRHYVAFMRRSLRLDIQLAGERLPVLLHLADQRGRAFGCARTAGRKPEGDQPLLDVGILEEFADLPVEPEH